MQITRLYFAETMAEARISRLHVSAERARELMRRSVGRSVLFQDQGAHSHIHRSYSHFCERVHQTFVMLVVIR